MTGTSGDDRGPRGAPHGAPYTAPYGGPYASAPAVHQHSGATASMVVGILALALSCGYGLTLLASPVAWWLGRRSLREIDASGGTLSGRGLAQAGMVTGIVGTVLLGVAVLAVVGMLVYLFSYHGQRF
jgi:hypothetical protein